MVQHASSPSASDIIGVTSSPPNPLHLLLDGLFAGLVETRLAVFEIVHKVSRYIAGIRG